MNDIIVSSQSIDSFVEETGVAIGRWGWITTDSECNDDEDEDKTKKRRFGMVSHIGSNYVGMDTPHGSSYRIHFDEWFDIVELVSDERAQEIIEDNIKEQKNIVEVTLRQIKELTARLGMADHLAIGTGSSMDAGSCALSTMSSTVDPKQYEKALTKAKDKELPALFNIVKVANKELIVWMKAEHLITQAQLSLFKGVIGEIEERIFHVSLYAGLTEEVVQVAKGKPAEFGPLHIMQGRLYMDEESLISYEAGGLEFKHLGDFDRWVRKHRDRVLPHERCVVSFRVRRYTKERETKSMLDAFVNMREAMQDKLTYLYIRNGKRIYRMGCDHDFGAKLFPDTYEFDFSEPMYVDSRGENLITEREYKEAEKNNREKTEKWKQWRKDNLPDLPDKNHPDYSDLENKYDTLAHKNPFGGGYSEPFFQYYNYSPFDQSHLYYDDAMESLAKQMKAYNRVVLILQGLFDRSEVFHPHPPVQLWQQQSFEECVSLVRDRGMVLHHGEPPSWEAYKARCNAHLKRGSVVLGAERAWIKREREKDQNWRRGSFRDSYFSLPYGDPGPGRFARVTRIKRDGQCGFDWYRNRKHWKGYGEPRLKTGLDVPADELFCLDGYTPGDFHQFYDDPRTRKAYLKWAPILLAAEDWHGTGKPVSTDDPDRQPGPSD